MGLSRIGCQSGNVCKARWALLSAKSIGDCILETSGTNLFHVWKWPGRGIVNKRQTRVSFCRVRDQGVSEPGLRNPLHARMLSEVRPQTHFHALLRENLGAEIAAANFATVSLWTCRAWFGCRLFIPLSFGETCRSLLLPLHVSQPLEAGAWWLDLSVCPLRIASCLLKHTNTLY
jgi:hypothetical protein